MVDMSTQRGSTVSSGGSLVPLRVAQCFHSDWHFFRRSLSTVREKGIGKALSERRSSTQLFAALAVGSEQQSAQRQDQQGHEPRGQQGGAVAACLVPHPGGAGLGGVGSVRAAADAAPLKDEVVRQGGEIVRPVRNRQRLRH